MRRILITFMALATLAIPTTALAAPGGGAGGVSGPAFYVDGELYRTVGTPTDFENTGAPAHSFDTIYVIPNQPNVATAAPGDEGYNGGRWMVHALDIEDYEAAVAAVDMNGSGDIDSDAEVVAALAGGYAEDLGVVRSFECPVIPLPKGN